MLESITLKIGEKEITLTGSEALQLYAELDALFGKRAEPWAPIIYPCPDVVWPSYPIVTCTSDTVKIVTKFGEYTAG